MPNRITLNVPDEWFNAHDIRMGRKGKAVVSGIDWNRGKFIIYAETSLTTNERKMAMIFSMMRNARRLSRKSLEKYTNAQLYAELVGTGASTAHVKCNEFGVDPEKKEV